MDVLIYTQDDQEYQELTGILIEEAGVVNVYHGTPDIKRQYHNDYDLIIAACDDETSLRLIRQWKECSETVQMIWIVEKDHHMKDAFQYSVFDCFTRPYDAERARHAIRYVIPQCPRRNCWTFGMEAE